MSRQSPFGRSGDDPAGSVVSELYAEISRELGTDGPQETFGHPQEGRIGHLVEDDHGMGSHDDYSFSADDSHDVLDLSAEEQAMHVMTDDEFDDEFGNESSDGMGDRDLDLSPARLAELTDL